MRDARNLKGLAIALMCGSIPSAAFAGVTSNSLFVALFLGGIICGCAADVVSAIERAGRLALSQEEGER